MKNASWIVLILLLLSCGISIGIGSYIGGTSQTGMADFKAVYFGTRCVLRKNDPYKISDFLSVYRAEGGTIPSDPLQTRMFMRAVPVCINLPTTLFLILPLAYLPWWAAHVLWTIFLSIGLTLSAFLMWNLGEKFSTHVTLILICIILANCLSIFTLGNAAGIAVSLCIIAVWCFLRDRFIAAAVVCLAISLVIKPHDGGFIWLYFLLTGRVNRIRALQTLAVAVAIGLASILWVSQAAPNWMAELDANIAVASSHGGLNDPGPDSLTGRMPEMIIDLQSILSVVRDDPHFYNPISYLICGLLLLMWVAKTRQSVPSAEDTWLALAAVIPLTMLITYHRPPDAKLLLLTIPACAFLWIGGGQLGRVALVVNTAAVILTSDIPLAILVILANHFHVHSRDFSGKVLTLVLTRPATLALLAMALFYLWVYLYRTSGKNHRTESGGHEGKEAITAIT